jgi:hypothetical protein
MKYWTLLEIREKILRDLGMQDEEIVDTDELASYVNEGVDIAEAEIHTLYEDYFLSRSTISLIAGTEEYGLPSDIYAHKIRRILYHNDAVIREIPRLRDWHKFENYTLEKRFTAGNVYEYMLINVTAGAPKILFVPTPTEAGAFIEIWYIRNANELLLDTDICDIPEFVSFVIQYAKVKCLEKARSPKLETAIPQLESLRQQMVDTLTAMVPDADSSVEPDISHYQEHS